MMKTENDRWTQKFILVWNGTFDGSYQQLGSGLATFEDAKCSPCIPDDTHWYQVFNADNSKFGICEYNGIAFFVLAVNVPAPEEVE